MGLRWAPCPRYLLILYVQDTTLYTQYSVALEVVHPTYTAETSSRRDDGPGTARSPPSAAGPQEPLARDQARGRGVRAQPLRLDRTHPGGGDRQARPEAATASVRIAWKHRAARSSK